MATRRGGSPLAVLTVLGLAALLTYGPPGPRAAAQDVAHTAGVVVTSFVVGVSDTISALLVDRLVSGIADEHRPGASSATAAAQDSREDSRPGPVTTTSSRPGGGHHGERRHRLHKAATEGGG